MKLKLRLPSNVLLLACLMGQYCFSSWRLSSSVTLPVGGPASCWARGRFARRWPSVWESGGWHYMAGQCGYIRLRQHLVFLHSRSNLLICMTKHLSFSFYCIVMYTVLHHKHTTRTTWTATKKTSYRIYSRISRQFLAAYTRVMPHSQSRQSAWRLSVSDAYCVCAAHGVDH